MKRVLLMLLAGCASQPGFSELGGERVHLEDSGQVVQPKAKPVAERARSFRTPHACQSAAAEQLRFDGALGWELFTHCVAREDFTDINVLLEDPWLALVVKQARKGIRLVVTLLDHRGGNFELDLGLLNSRGIGLFSLNEAMKAPEKYAGRLVLFRGKVLEKEKNGPYAQLLVVEMKRQALHFENKYSEALALIEVQKGKDPKTVDRGDVVVSSHTVSVETNRRVTAFVKSWNGEAGKEYLLLGRFEDPPEAVRLDGILMNVMTVEEVVRSY